MKTEKGKKKKNLLLLTSQVPNPPAHILQSRIPLLRTPRRRSLNLQKPKHKLSETIEQAHTQIERKMTGQKRKSTRTHER